MAQIRETIFHSRHLSLNARMAHFAHWDMPIQYDSGIVAEHLATRKHAGLFDVSHMGRFTLGGGDSLAFLQYVLSNDISQLAAGKSLYTIIPDCQGNAIDDAYLYRFTEEEYLLVVNACNKDKDAKHLQAMAKDFCNLELRDDSEALAMLSLQGPCSESLLGNIIDSGALPAAGRNNLGTITINRHSVLIARTGYTGEPIGFELMPQSKNALGIWDALVKSGASPIGLGARDTLRLEASLPLYGHEFGLDPGGNEIPVFACPLANFAVKFTQAKGNFIGKEPLKKQYDAFAAFKKQDFSLIRQLPRTIRSIALIDRGVARAFSKVYHQEKHVGYVTSGTMVPYWKNQSKYGKRSIAMVIIDSDVPTNAQVTVEVRGKKLNAQIVPAHLDKKSRACAKPINIKQ